MINYVVLNKSDNSFFCYADNLASIDTTIHVAVPYDSQKSPEVNDDLLNYYTPLANAVIKNDLDNEKVTRKNIDISGRFTRLVVGDVKTPNNNFLAEFGAGSGVIGLPFVSTSNRPSVSSSRGGISFNPVLNAFEFSDGSNYTVIRNTTSDFQVSLDSGLSFQDIITSTSSCKNSNITNVTGNTVTLNNNKHIYVLNIPTTVTLPTYEIGRCFVLYTLASIQVIPDAGSTINGALGINVSAGQTCWIQCISENKWIASLSSISESAGNAGITRSVNNVSSNISVGSAPSTDYVYFCTNSITLTLPNASSNTNRYLIINKGSGSITVASFNNQTFNNTTGPLVINKQFTQVELFSDSSNWFY